MSLRPTFLHLLTRLCLLHVIANQCAHWCGNPFPRRNAWQVGTTSGKFVVLFVFAQSTTLRYALAARRTDCPVASLLAMTVGEVLAPVDTSLSSACHCEPVRTLAWQSVFPAEKLGKVVALRANPLRLTHSPKVLLPAMPYRRRSGLPRRFAPRNDMQKHAAVRMSNYVLPGQGVTPLPRFPPGAGARPAAGSAGPTPTPGPRCSIPGCRPRCS